MTPHSRAKTLQRCLGGLALSAACTTLALLLRPVLSLTDVVMVYVLGAAIAGLTVGRAGSAVTAIANVALFNFCFVPPRFSFAVADRHYLVTFAALLAVALVIAQLVATVRARAREVSAEARHATRLYEMSRELVMARGVESLTAVACRHVEAVFDAPAQLLLPDRDGRLRADPAALEDADLDVAQGLLDAGGPEIRSSAVRTVSGSSYLLLRGATRRLGVLVVKTVTNPTSDARERIPLLEAFGSQIALALERAQFAGAAESARLATETEKLRNTLLGSISHDLRTPLAVITGASSTLADPRITLDPAAREALIHTIEHRARDVAALVTNVLDLLRLESSPLNLRRDWEALDDLTGAALARIHERLVAHPVDVALPADLPPLYVDAGLVTQLIANLMENAARHTPPGTPLRIHAQALQDAVLVHVDDDGPGLPEGPAEQLFAKFHRGRLESDSGGAGLGLAICKAIVEAHGGWITAANRATGGARFSFTLPRQARA